MTLEQLGQDQRFMNTVRNTLNVFPYEPFLCLPMSCCLLGHLEQECPEYVLTVKTGDLFYNNHALFKQEFDLNNLKQEYIKTSWDGHAWLEINDQFIVDLSIGRTISSPLFTTLYRNEIVQLFGGKIAIIDKHNNNTPLRYVEHSVLSDLMIDGIIKGACERFFSQS